MSLSPLVLFPLSHLQVLGEAGRSRFSLILPPRLPLQGFLCGREPGLQGQTQVRKTRVDAQRQLESLSDLHSAETSRNKVSLKKNTFLGQAPPLRSSQRFFH